MKDEDEDEDEDEGLHFFSVELDDFSPKNMLVMVANELGLVVEYGFNKNQYVLKKKAPPGTHVKTLYCSARNNGDTFSFTGAIELYKAVALADPKFFDKLKEILTDDFLLPSSRRFDIPIVGRDKLHR